MTNITNWFSINSTLTIMTFDPTIWRQIRRSRCSVFTCRGLGKSDNVQITYHKLMYKVIVRLCHNSGRMVRVLNVAEKNDAAKSIADVMSRGGYRKREGFSRFNKIYEFDHHVLNQNCLMTMTSVSGHLLGMEFDSQYRKWNSCSPLSLFDAPVFKSCPDNYVDIKRTLEREAKGCSYLIVWTDCDREGENIGFEVIQVCQAVKPNLKVFRAKFSEITPQAVMRAVNNLQSPDKRISDAVDVRQELDLRIGAAFTRFQTLRLQKVFPEHLNQQLISYGSCQFPTLGFVVERYKQVQAFIPEPFWKLKVTHQKEDIKAEFLWKRNRLFDHLACLVLYDQCIENPVATVIDVKSKSKSKWRPQALDTVELEKLASRKLRINAKETMKIAEKLYTQGYISYPRTETNIFPKELDLAGLVQEQTRDPNWGGFAQMIVERGPTPRNGNKTDNAHPPIHPIKYTANLQGNEQRVYEFVVRHFLACCSQDAQGMETSVEISIGEERFVSSGLMIIARNYLDIYPYEKWNAKEIPVYEQGDQFEPSAVEMLAGETSPPPLLSEADLIALMEKHGIGTDATHADHIETIKDRSYVGVRPDSRFVPGQLGMGLVEGYDEMGYQMSKPHLRAELEADLLRICEGKKDKNVVLREQVEKYKAVFTEAFQQALKLDEALAQYFGQAQTLTNADVTNISGGSSVRKCPLCGHSLALKTKKDGKGFFIGCSGYPQCRAVIWLPDFVLQAEVTDEDCVQCQPGPVKKIKFRFRRGSTPPMIPSEYTGCVGGCDEMLSNVLDIQPLSARDNRNATTNTPRSLARTSSSSGYSSSGNNGTNSGTNNRQQPQNNPWNNNTSNRSFVTSAKDSFKSGQIRQAVVQVTGNSHPPASSFQSNTTFSAAGGAGDGSVIVCNCGTDAILLTVRKEGPNTGREFYKCSKPSGSGCTFFLWADENTNQNNSGMSSRSNTSWSTSRTSNSRPNLAANNSWGDNSGDSSEVVCRCGQTAKFLTVQKEGGNKGRQFYACPKPRGEGCNFFQWADDSSGGGSSGGGSHGSGMFMSGGGGKKRFASGDAGGPTGKKRKCGLCGVEGHTKRSCPHK